MEVGLTMLGISLDAREAIFAASICRFKTRAGIPAIRIGELELPEAKENEVLEIPRWACMVLSDAGLGEVAEESFESELFKALSRERIQTSTSLSSLRSDIFTRMMLELDPRWRTDGGDQTQKPNRETVLTSAYDLVTMRSAKLVSHASAESPHRELMERLTQEEAFLFGLVQNMVSSWRKRLLKGREEP